MTGFYYPPLDSGTLQSLDVVRELMEQHRDYFEESPYPSTTEKLLRKWFPPMVSPLIGAEPLKRGPGRPRKDAEPAGYLDDSHVTAPPEEPKELPVFEGLRAELEDAHRILKSVRHLKGTDLMDYAKQSVSLLEKMVKLQGAIKNIELVGQFQSTVLMILDEVCTPEQQSQFMAKLQAYLDVDEMKVADAVKPEAKSDNT